jgi:hypothetical protein
MVPAGLAPGEYTLMVQARFGQKSLRRGLLEEAVKLSLGLWRVYSKRWIHQLAVPA